MRSAITICLLFIFSCINAQSPVKAPKENGHYILKEKRVVIEEGDCTNGYKTGTWTYNGDYGSKKREEDFDASGILFRTRKYSFNAVYSEQYTLVNDVYSGEYKSFSEYSDFISIKGWYSNGLKDSLWFFYRIINNEQNLWKTEAWQNGKCRGRKVFYPTGKVFRVDLIDESGSTSAQTYFDKTGAAINNRVWVSAKDSLISDSLLNLKPADRRLPDSAVKILTYETMPEFYDSGKSSLFLMQNVKYPRAAKDIPIQGTIYVTFDINIYGDMENFRITKPDPGKKSLEDEALRVIQMYPPWKPATIGGKYKNVEMTLPIRFILQ